MKKSLARVAPAMCAALIASAAYIVWSAVKEVKAMEKEFGGKQD